MWHVFFFQAEDGIRDYKVTGVQTCALPISSRMWLSDIIRHLSKAANSKTNRSQSRPIHRTRLSHLKEERLGRLFERRTLEDHHAICPLTWTEPSAAHPEVRNGQLLGR